MVLWVVGKEPLANGMRLVNSHIDSIRLELKPHPLREQNGTVTLDTLVHGGLKADMVTDEEVGSRWNISVSSQWFRKLVSEMVRAEKGAVTELDVMECFSKTHMVTADTTTATNPLWPAPQAKDNASLMHHGLVVKLYGPGRSANSEFMAHLRRILDDADVGWQTHTYKAGYGGGTIAGYFAGWNMEVTDWGVGIWSMHSTYDVASKADIWALYEGFGVFFNS